MTEDACQLVAATENGQRTSNLHPVAFGVGHALQRLVKVDGAHDAIAELLLNQRLPGGAVHLHKLVEAVDERLRRKVNEQHGRNVHSPRTSVGGPGGRAPR